MVSDFGDYSCRLQRLYSRLKQRVYNATIRKCGQGFRCAHTPCHENIIAYEMGLEGYTALSRA